MLLDIQPVKIATMGGIKRGLVLLNNLEKEVLLGLGGGMEKSTRVTGTRRIIARTRTPLFQGMTTSTRFTVPCTVLARGETA